MLSFLYLALLFCGIGFGLAWSLVSRLALAPAEKIVASVSLSLLTVFLLAWIIYISELPPTLLWALVPLTAVSLAWNATALVATFRDADARRFIVAQFLVSGWCLGWLAWVVSYSGGG